jgi:hypothetical protein
MSRRTASQRTRRAAAEPGGWRMLTPAAFLGQEPGTKGLLGGDFGEEDEEFEEGGEEEEVRASGGVW